jgi:hypothetical protein
VVVKQQNFVLKVAGLAGVSLATSTAYNDKPISVANHADQAIGNAENIGIIADQVASQMEGPSQGAPEAGGGPSVMRTALTAGALAVGAIFAPGLAAGAGAAMAVGEAVNFSLKGNSAKGELTLANSAATFDKDGEMTSYTSAADGVTSSMSGQPIQVGATAPAAKGMKNLGSIITEVGADYSRDEIADDIRAMLKKQKETFGRDMTRLAEMGAINPNDPKALEIKDMMAELTDAKPRPRALNVGMGSPSMG